MPETLELEPEVQSPENLESASSQEVDRAAYEAAEKMVNQERWLQKFANAFVSFMQALISDRKQDSPETALRDELVLRKVVSPEDAQPLTLAELEQHRDDFYTAKEELISTVQVADDFFPGEIPQEPLYGPLKIALYAHHPQYADVLSISHHDTSGDSALQLETLRKDLDLALPDAVYFEYLAWKAAKDERKRKGDLQKKIETNERNFWQSPARRGHSEKADQLHRQYKARVERVDELKYLATIKSEEEAALTQVNEILGHPSLSTEDRDHLSTWLKDHQEFGAENMDDAEYFAYFEDGRFYMHSSGLFHDGKNEIKEQRFTEALKDGFLIGKYVADERNDKVIGLAAPQYTVSFDSQRVLLPTDQKNEYEWPHLSYGISSMQSEIPLTLIAPAQLLEVYSTNRPVDWKSNKVSQHAEGEPFGSGNPDSTSRSHEIPLSLFVMVVPDIKLDRQQLETWLRNFEEDSRFSTITKLDEWNQAKAGLLQTVEDEVELQIFLTSFLGTLKHNGISTPRLLCPKLEDNPADDQGGIMYFDRAVRAFLAEHKIPISAKDLCYGRDKEPINLINQSRSEQYKVPAYVYNDTANKVRVRLKK